MALHYLLDGYNIVKQTPSLAEQEWEQGRASLVKVIEKGNLQGSSNNQVTIFFDGRPGRVDTPGTARVKVVFTDDKSADDCIKEVISRAPNKKAFVVVTEDREIQYYVRSLGAQVVKVSEFLSKANKAPAGEKDRKIISSNLEQQITSEFEKIWLDKKKNKNL